MTPVAIQIIPPMTLNLLGSYLEDHHPLANQSWQRRSAMWTPEPGRSWERTVEQAGEQKPGAIFFYPNEEHHNCLWFEVKRADDIIAAYHRLTHQEADDVELLSLLQLWSSLVERWVVQARTVQPVTGTDLLSAISAVTLVGAERLRQRLEKDGVEPNIPLTQEVIIHSIYDNFFDDVCRMEDNDQILAWHLAQDMVQHLSETKTPAVATAEGP